MHSFRRALLAATLTLVTGLISSAQSSKYGSFDGRTFTDSHFNVSFDLPPFLDPQPVNSTTITARETTDARLMAIAREGKESYGIIMMAQHVEPGGIVSADDFLRRVRASRSPGDVMGIVGHRLNANGLTFDWLDWKEAGGGRDSAVITRRGDYLIVARCNAKDDNELQSMKNALFGMRLVSK